MQKAYDRIKWENYPSKKSPVNESNLNKIDTGLDEIDNRVISMDTTKLDKTTAASMVKDITFNEKTGVFNVTYLNGATATIDTKLERLVINWGYDKETQQLVLTLDDGTTQTVDLSALITQYEFMDTDTIAFSVGTNGEVSANVKSGSITEDKIEPNYLVNVKVEAAKAEAGAVSSEASATAAKSYCHGGTKTRENEDTDNAEYYYRQAKQISQSLNGIIPQGTVAFADLPTEGMAYGYMYNISDEFVSDERFNDGGGVYYGPGNNVIWISGDLWDVTAGSSVTGVKGANQSTYQQGNVSLSASDVGAVASGGDTAQNTIGFTSEDNASPTAWADVALLQSGEKHGSVLSKISTMFKNVRWLYKTLGTTDISAIGDGTVKGAIATQNDNFTNKYNELNNALSQKAPTKTSYLVSVSDNAYTATEDCYIQVTFHNGANTIMNCALQTNIGLWVSNTTTVWEDVHLFVPLNKGQTVLIMQGGNNTEGFEVYAIPN